MKSCSKPRSPIMLVVVLVLLCLSGCGNNGRFFKDDITKKINEIKAETEEAGNPDPREYLDIRFTNFKQPDENYNMIDQGIRFEAKGNKTVNMQILAYYDNSADELLVSRGGSITGEKFEPLDLEPGTGWEIVNNLSLIKDWNEFTPEEQQRIIDSSYELYFKITVDNQPLYFICDFRDNSLIY